MLPKPKRPLPPQPAEPPIERPLPPGRKHRPSIGAGAGVAVAVALLAALALGWWLGRWQHAPEPPAEEKPALVTLPVTTPVSPIVPPVATLPQSQEPVATTVSATKPARVVPAVVPPKPKPVVTQYTVGPAKPLAPRLPPAGDGHVLDAGQVLYCMATGELLDEVTPHAYLPAAQSEIEDQTEQYNRRCGAYSYSAGNMERAMQRLEQIRPKIHARARELMRKWGADGRTPPTHVRYFEYDDSDW